ncbi:MAG: hypothetical protein Q4C86_03250 [bacterium]|nr:hypothetical protein [bacterium]
MLRKFSLFVLLALVISVLLALFLTGAASAAESCPCISEVRYERGGYVSVKLSESASEDFYLRLDGKGYLIVRDAAGEEAYSRLLPAKDGCLKFVLADFSPPHGARYSFEIGNAGGAQAAERRVLSGYFIAVPGWKGTGNDA